MLRQAPSDEEIRFNAERFAREHGDYRDEEKQAQTFLNDFFGIFGIKRSDVAEFEYPVKNPGGTTEFIDLLWPKKVLVEMKSRGRRMSEAMDQAFGYYALLRKDEEPRYILACDFENWYLRDKRENSDHHFRLDELADHIGLFGFMVDRPKVVHADAVNQKASEMIGNLFDAMKDLNYNTRQVEYLLTRIVFCMFADDTGIFANRGMFQQYVSERTKDDGSDLSLHLKNLFMILNQPREERPQLINSKTNAFPYIDGSLFEDEVEIPEFNADMRRLLLDAGEYDWSKVSPAIFGTMFQTVMNPKDRREMGAHYTTEENILKVIRPLFLDGLNREFDEIDMVTDGSKKERFAKFQEMLAGFSFLDPACGSGNFLVIAYRELRRLEHRAIMKIHGHGAGRNDTDELSKVNVDQFYGIEINDFSRRIAEISLWMMDHLMNLELSNTYGWPFRRIPIRAKPNIVFRDALEMDWESLLPAKVCNYILGNPPFGGSKTQTPDQRGQIRKIAALGGGVVRWTMSPAGSSRHPGTPLTLHLLASWQQTA